MLNKIIGLAGLVVVVGAAATGHWHVVNAVTLTMGGLYFYRRWRDRRLTA